MSARSATTDSGKHPEAAQEHLDREVYGQFVGYANLAAPVVLVLLGIAALFGGIDRRVAVLVVLIAILVLAASQHALRQRRSMRTVALLVSGMWLITTLTIVFGAGIHSAGFAVFPIMLGLVGRLKHGARALLVLTGATVAFTLGLMLAQVRGLYRAPVAQEHPLLAGLVLAGALGTVALLTFAAHLSFARSRERAVAFSEALAQHNIRLAHREAELQWLMDTMPVGVAVYDATRHLTQANAHYLALYQRQGAEVLGKSVNDLLGSQSTPGQLAAWDAVFGGQAQNFSRRLLMGDGNEAHIDVRMVPRMSDGRVESVIAVAQDVSDLYAAHAAVRELNEQLEARVAERSAELAATMEQLRGSQENLLRSQAKAEIAALVAGVSHELGTPLGNSVMAASTLNDQARRFLALVEAGQLKRSDLTQFFSTLLEGTDLMQRNLLRARELLLNFKQVAADQASEQRRPFDLAETIAEVLQSLSPSLKRHHHRIVVDIAADISMDSYPGPLGQVIINLVNNAVMHAFAGRQSGTLTISARTGNDAVHLAVEDDGAGMPDDVRKRLFEPFFSTRIGAGGTGLGMSIVEGIVRKTLGGSVHVDSKVGRGTRFDITIPRRAPDPARP